MQFRLGRNSQFGFFIFTKLETFSSVEGFPDHGDAGDALGQAGE